jgi:hypothetical protein
VSGSFDLTLRTHAPVITWGALSGYVPGGAFSVAYTLDEPAIIDARLIDFDGVVFPLTIESDRLTVNLPDTVALGQATVEADVLDDVDNATTRTLTLAIQATIIPPQPVQQVVTGLPRETPPPRRREEHKRSRSTLRVRTASRVLVAAVEQTRIAVGTEARVRTTQREHSAVTVSTLARQTAHHEVATAVTFSTTGAVSRDESQVALLALLLS